MVAQAERWLAQGPTADKQWQSWELKSGLASDLDAGSVSRCVPLWGPNGLKEPKTKYIWAVIYPAKDTC